MKLFRPHIPVLKRVLAARRQLSEMGIHIERPPGASLTWYLDGQLLPALDRALPGEGALQLDHNPALGLRRRRGEGKETVYTPAANDHRYLEYRRPAPHLKKTTGRNEGAQRTVTTKGSDIWLMGKFRKLEAKTKPRKSRIPSRPFPKGKRRFGG